MLYLMLTLSLHSSAVLAADKNDSESFRSTPVDGVIAKVRSVSDDGKTLKVKVGRRTYQVNLEAGRRLVHSAQKLSSLSAGPAVSVLCRQQEAQNGGADQKLDPQYVQIAAIVVGPYEPPALTPAQKKSKVQWYTGTLDNKEKNRFRLGGINMQVGNDRLVTVLAWTPKAKFRKGHQIRIQGATVPAPETDDPKLKRKLAKLTFVEASVVEILTTRIPAKEYIRVLGPPPRPAKKKRK